MTIPHGASPSPAADRQEAEALRRVQRARLFRDAFPLEYHRLLAASLRYLQVAIEAREPEDVALALGVIALPLAAAAATAPLRDFWLAVRASVDRDPLLAVSVAALYFEEPS